MKSVSQSHRSAQRQNSEEAEGLKTTSETFKNNFKHSSTYKLQEINFLKSKMDVIFKKSHSLDSKHSKTSETSSQNLQDTMDNVQNQGPDMETHQDPRQQDQVLLDLMADVSQLVLDREKEKNHGTGMVSEFRNVSKMQSDFNQMKLDLATVKAEIDKAKRDHENQNAIAVQPPTYFAPEDRMEQNEKLRESVQKAFPSFTTNRGSMFNGRGGKTGDLSVRQFLSNMTSLQDMYKLSEKEFLAQLMRSCSGIAYDFLIGHLQEGSCNTRQAYQYLLARFDRSLAPEAAKAKLHSLRATKQDDLMKLIGGILQLVTQASLGVPKAFRKLFMDSEANDAIIRALPTQSKNFAQSKLVDLQSSTEAEIPTFHSLAEVLTRHSKMINEDLAANGGSADREFRGAGRRVYQIEIEGKGVQEKQNSEQPPAEKEGVPTKTWHQDNMGSEH